MTHSHFSLALCCKDLFIYLHLLLPTKQHQKTEVFTRQRNSIFSVIMWRHERMLLILSQSSSMLIIKNFLLNHWNYWMKKLHLFQKRGDRFLFVALKMWWNFKKWFLIFFRLQKYFYDWIHPLQTTSLIETKNSSP